MEAAERDAPRANSDSRRQGGGAVAFFRQTGIFWVLVLLIIVVSLVSPVFMTQRNMMNVMKQTSITGILGVGMTFVLISGGIDLSVGSVIAISGVVAASTAVANSGIPFALTILTAVGIGTLCGLINGIGVAYITYPPFIMTLGMMSAARGAALVYTNGKPIFGLSKSFVDVANGSLLGITNLIWFFIAVMIAGWFILKKTVFGRQVYAIGGNREAARLSGINVKKISVLTYILCATLAAASGIFMTARLGSAQPTAGTGMEMIVITASVIGGTSMFGGSGSIAGTFIGVIFMSILYNSMTLLRISVFWQQLVIGIILILAVIVDQINRERRERMGR